MLNSVEVGRKLIEILRNADTISENSVIEFKREPHLKDSHCELYKDILGLANSYEKPNEDRWLIFGVEDKDRKLVGVNKANQNLLDDANYHQILNKIHPDLHFEFIVVPADRVKESFSSDLVFASFYIPCECVGAVHELSEPVNNKHSQTERERSYSAGSSFIRIGSETRPLREEHRVEIRKRVLASRPATFKISSPYTSFNALTASMDSLLLIGSWDESNDSDKDFLSKICGKPYVEAIRELHPLLESGVFNVKGPYWSVVNRTEALEQVGKHLTREALHSLADLLSQVLVSINHSFDLPANERFLADIRGVDRGASKQLREGVASFCACVANKPELLPHCTYNDIEQFVRKILSPVFASEDWRVFASSENCFPLLAEASPLIYLSGVNEAFENGALKHLFGERANNFLSFNLGGSLVSGIRIAALGPKMLSKAVSTLVTISEYEKTSKDAIVNLLLAWYPCVDAPLETKIGAASFLAKNEKAAAWDALIALLPDNTMATISTVTPVYMRYAETPERVPAEEYWKLSRGYCFEAMNGAKGNLSRVKDIVSNLHSFNIAGLTDDVIKMLKNESDDLEPDARYKIWNVLMTYVEKCKKFKDAQWAPSEEVLERFVELTEAISPEDDFYLALRFCSINDWDLIQIEEDPSRGQERVAGLRADALSSIYHKEGFSVIDKLLAHGAQGGAVGVALARAAISKEDEIRTLEKFDSDEYGEDYKVAHSYSKNKFGKDEWSWVESIDFASWPHERIAKLFAGLPLSKKTWEEAERLLEDDSFLYWEKVAGFGLIENSKDLEYYVEKLLEVGRAAEAISSLELMGVSNGVEVSVDQVKKALWSLRVKEVDTMLSYRIQKLFEFLEKQSCDNELFALEFQYAPLLDEEPEAYLYRHMSENPEAFLRVLSVVLNLGVVDEGKAEISSASRLKLYMSVLRAWKIPPGLTEDKLFHSEIFEKWIKGVMEHIKKPEHFEIVYTQIGHALFYSPASEELFVPECVAKFLEQSDSAREGYSVEAFNSRGVHFVDPTGAEEDKIADDYDAKAFAAETCGYLNFATSLRDIAKSFRREAEYNREDRF